MKGLGALQRHQLPHPPPLQKSWIRHLYGAYLSLEMSTLCKRLTDQTEAYGRRPSRPNRPNGTSTGRRQSKVGMGESSRLTVTTL